MKRSLLTLSGLAAALMLVGCATQSAPTAPAAAAPKAAAAPAAPAAPAATAVSDAAMAEKLKGQWVGEWEFPGIGSGKFIFIATSVESNNLQGEAHWYGTAAGDLKLPLQKAVVEKGVLKGLQSGEKKFQLKMKSDTEMVGTWDMNGYSGPLKVKR